MLATFVLAALAAPVAARLGEPAAGATSATPPAADALDNVTWPDELAALWAQEFLAESRGAHGEASIPNLAVNTSTEEAEVSNASFAEPGESADYGGNASASLLLQGSRGRRTYGYAARASTTRYGDTSSTACGGIDTARLVAGTGYYAVASSQAMQSHFRGGGSCCYCGTGAKSSWAKGTAAMGCFTCARGRFLRARPFNGMDDAGGFASQEVRIVVADICPSSGNTGWCQQAPGGVNAVGEKNHFDFAELPGGIDNNFFVFSPEPCSPQIRARMAGGLGRCAR